ncbi:Juvenile hormone esterase [Habropoda laboriosa]|uniref:Carboxylic ester hydrolase n=1 Tax=Habropoda laboriosa TaxID=597456 RepID=A0A0L7R854_9HYME|nr:Juvenile hormone esterase [Habropoda laboriosa]
MGTKVLVLFALFSIQQCKGQSGPVVQTENGAVRGLYNTTVWRSMKFSSFRGIPYGKPPVGHLRFQPPLPAEPWEGTLNATKVPNPCPQYDFLGRQLVGREDCLNINVYTPVTDFGGSLKLKPVMVWIYGGAFSAGFSNDTLYGPSFLVERDVVIVTFNYRVGVLGFLSLNHPRALGNAGTKDQYLVLQWVNKNIAAFGGDPNQVTLFGMSSGAMCIGLHVLSEKAAGLFSKVILISGTPLSRLAHQTSQDAYNSAYQLALLLGHNSTSTEDLLDFLSQAPAFELSSATQLLVIINSVNCNELSTWKNGALTTIENTTIDYNNTAYVTQCSLTKYQSGNFNKVPTMLGYTHDEALFFLFPFTQSASPVRDATEYYSNVDPMTSKTFTDTVNDPADIGVDVFTKVGTDLYFISSIDLTQKLLAANNGNNSVYFYRQSYQSPYTLHKVYLHIPYDGVAHIDDVWYVWEASAIIPVPTDPNDPFYQYLNTMVSLYTNFAKYGNPTPEGNSPIDVTWTPSGAEGLQIDMNTTFTMNNRLADASALGYEPDINSTCN